MIELINALPDAVRFAWMDAAPIVWHILDIFFIVYEDGSIG